MTLNANTAKIKCFFSLHLKEETSLMSPSSSVVTDSPPSALASSDNEVGGEEEEETTPDPLGGDGDDGEAEERVTKLLRQVESQAMQGANCTPGTALSLGDKVVNRLSQERFHAAAMVAVNWANWLTR